MLLGKAWLVVDLLFLLAVPLAALGAYRFLLRVTSSLPMSLWGAVAYGVLPVVTGAVQQGRLGTVAGALVLPWLAHAALFLGPGHDDGPSPPRRLAHRAVARAAGRLRPGRLAAGRCWWRVVALAVGAPAAAGDRALGRRRSSPRWSPPWCCCCPGRWRPGRHQGAASWLFEAGLPAPRLAQRLTALGRATGRPGRRAPRAGWRVGVLLAALVALARPDTRTAVLRAWVVLVVALGCHRRAGRAAASRRRTRPTDQPLWLGFPLVVAQAAAITAAALAGTGIRRRLVGRELRLASAGRRGGRRAGRRSPRSPSAVWWVLGRQRRPARPRAAPPTIPTYMTDAAAADPDHGILVVRGLPRPRASATCCCAGPASGSATTRSLPVGRGPGAADRASWRTSSPLRSRPTSPALTGLGVAYVYAPRPADVGLVGNLDSVAGVTTGSATGPGARAWQLEAAPTGADLVARPATRCGPGCWRSRASPIVVVAVLAAPTRKARR